MRAIVLVTLIVYNTRTLTMCNGPSWIKVGCFCTPVPVVPRVRVFTQMKPSSLLSRTSVGVVKHTKIPTISLDFMVVTNIVPIKPDAFFFCVLI
jgi:hypothetical protein